MKRGFWAKWAGGWIIWIVVTSTLAFLWLKHEIAYEYKMGWRTTTDGDSLGIPLAGYIFLNIVVSIVLSVGIAAYGYLRQRRAT